MRFWRPSDEAGLLADGTTPTRCPAARSNERWQWDHAAKSLAGLLRHGATDVGLHMDRGGWVQIEEILQFCPISTRYRPLWEYRPNMAWICGVVASGFKGRFQLALAFADAWDAGGWNATGLSGAWPYAVRATSGHSINGLDGARIYRPLTPEALDQISALSHQTRLDNVLPIFASGL